MFKHVVVAIIINDNNEVLISQRPVDKPYAGYWEFPGGKVEKGEKAFSALKRELFEELNLEIQNAHSWIQIPYTYPHAKVMLDTWVVESFKNEAVGKEGQSIKWVRLKDLQHYQFPEGNVEILKQLSSLSLLRS